MEKRKLSIVIPLFNEEEVFEALWDRLVSVLDSLERLEFEILFVDDGSRDKTPELLESLASQDERVKFLILSRNFGHQIALSAGLDHVSGDLVFFMDGDLQDPPELLPKMLEIVDQGHDVAYGFRSSREGGALLRSSYFVFYRLLSRLSDIDIPLDAGDFCLFTRRVGDALRRMPERHKFLRGMRAWTGFRHKGVPYDRPERFAGSSKYSVRKLFRLAFNGLFSNSLLPLRLATVLGGLVLFFCLSVLVYWVYVRLVYDSLPTGFAASTLVLFLLSGAQFMLLGIVGEYVGRIYEEVKSRPIYFVEKTNLNS